MYQYSPHDQQSQHQQYQQQIWPSASVESPLHITSPQPHRPQPHHPLPYYPPSPGNPHYPPHLQQQQDYIAYGTGYPQQQQPPNPSDGSLQRSTSMATHTTFKINGVQYRPPQRRHASEDASMRPNPRSPATNPRSPITNPRSPGPIPTSPAASFTSSESRAAFSPWGYLFAPNTYPATPTPKLTRLLTSVGSYLSALPPATEAVITREKLVSYYAAQTPHPRLDHRAAYLRTATPRGLGRLWTWLRCRFYWVPMEGQGELLPALTIGGFVRWSVVQLLLCPDLEVGVLDALLRTVELRDPETPSVVWPKGLDREAVGGVDPVAGEMWGQWWGVLLEPDEDDEEADLEDLEALKRRVVELEARRGSVLIEGGVRERKRGDDGRVDAELEKLTRELEGAVGPCARCGERSWCRCGDDAKLG